MVRRNLIGKLILIVCISLPIFGVSQTEQTLRVAIYDAAPFGYQNPDGTYDGLMVDLWESIARELEWDFQYELTDMDGLLAGLQNDQYDIGLGAISITPSREALVDFTQPVNPSGTGIATARKAQGNAFRAYWRPLVLSLAQLVGSLLLVLLISGGIVWWAEKHATDPDDDDERAIRGISDALWWSAVTMTTVGYGDKVPKTRVGKSIGIIWIFTSIILLSLFTANASAIITTAKVESHIQTASDLKRSRVAAVSRSSGEEFLIREHIPYHGYDDYDQAIRAVLDGKADCLVSNVPFLKYFNNSSYYQQLAISPKWLLKNNMGIALQDDSSLREPIDLILLEKITEPKWQAAVYEYLGEE